MARKPEELSNDPRPTGRRGRAVDHPTKPPDPYIPPKLPSGGGELPNPEVTERTGGGQEQQRREITLDGVDDGPRAIEYGEQRLTGKLQFAHYDGNYDHMWCVIELCAGECDGVIDVTKQDGSAAPIGTNNVGLTAVAPFCVNLWWYPGSSSGNVNPNIIDVVPSWNEAFPNTCHMVLQLISFSGYWGGAVPSLRVRQRCRKPLIPETGLHAYSTNGWDQLYDFARWSEGKQLSSSRLPAAPFIAAKAADAAAGRNVSMHFSLREDANPDDVINTFRIMLRTAWFFDRNQFKPVPHRPGSAVATYDDRFIVKRNEITGERSDVFERPNRVTIWYTDTANDWTLTPKSLPETPPDDCVEVDLRLPHLHDVSIVNSLLTYVLKSYQFDGRILETWNAATADRQLGDIVTRNIEGRGLSFTGRLVSRAPRPDNSFDVELLQHDDSMFSDASASGSTKVQSVLPDPSDPPPDISIGSVTIAEEAFYAQNGDYLTRAIITLTNPATGFFSHVEVWVSINGGEYRFDGTAPKGAGAQKYQYTGVMEVGVTYTFKFISVSLYDVKSAGVTKDAVFYGKTAIPTDVPRISATVFGSHVQAVAQPASDIDLMGYEWRFGLTTDTWEKARIIDQTKGVFLNADLPVGTWRLFCKAFDSGYRYSSTAASVDVTITSSNSLQLGTAEFQPLLGEHVYPGHDMYLETLAGGAIFIIEGIERPTTMDRIMMLAKSMSPADVDGAIAAAGYTTLQQWDDANLYSLWAPIPIATVTNGGVTTRTRVSAQFATSGFSWQIGTVRRNIDATVEIINPTRLGTDSDPSAHPAVEIGYGGKWSSTGVFSDAGGQQPKIRLSTNHPYAQSIVRVPKNTALWRATEWRQPIELEVVTLTTDGSGNASYTLARAMGTDQWPHVDLVVVGATGAHAQLVGRATATGFSIKTYDLNSGAALGGIIVDCFVRDLGGGGTSVIISS